MGLNFKTCTIINSNYDQDSYGVDKRMFYKSEDGAFHVKRALTLKPENIVAVRKAAGYQHEYCLATVDFSFVENLKNEDKGLKEEGKPVYCRLDIYVEYEGAEPFYGANPTQVRKGIPFWVEFTVTKNSTAESVAKEVEDSIKKNQLFLIDKNVIEVAVSEDKMTLRGTQEFARFKDIEIFKFGLTTEYPEKIASLHGSDEYVKQNKDQRGKNGFGTYAHIIKDLRLPTAANYQWKHLRQSEVPVIGTIYDQYIIEYKAPASNEGFHAVGMRMESCTEHIFWVNNTLMDHTSEEPKSVSASFEKMLKDVAKEKWEEETEEPTNPEGQLED